MTGGGSRKGCPNKNTKALKDMTLAALSAVGGVQYLKTRAEKNPSTFLTLIGKVLHTVMDGTREQRRMNRHSAPNAILGLPNKPANGGSNPQFYEFDDGVTRLVKWHPSVADDEVTIDHDDLQVRSGILDKCQRYSTHTGPVFAGVPQPKRAWTPCWAALIVASWPRFGGAFLWRDA